MCFLRSFDAGGSMGETNCQNPSTTLKVALNELSDRNRTSKASFETTRSVSSMRISTRCSPTWFASRSSVNCVIPPSIQTIT